MKNNEKIFVKSFYADTALDDFEKGESGNGSSWSSHTLNFKNAKNGYDSIADALKAICEANGFEYERNSWTAAGLELGEDFGRFDGAFTVDENNCEATDQQLEDWKNGKCKLWSCYINAMLEVRTIRELTEEEAKSFVKEQ